MHNIVYEFHVDKYCVMQLSDELPQSPYSRYCIDGKVFDAVMIYDMPKCIAILSDESFLGKEVKFIS